MIIKLDDLCKVINAVPHIEYKLKDADSYFYTWKGAQGEDAGKALTLGL